MQTARFLSVNFMAVTQHIKTTHSTPFRNILLKTVYFRMITLLLAATVESLKRDHPSFQTTVFQTFLSSFHETSTKDHSSFKITLPRSRMVFEERFHCKLISG